MGRAAHHIRKLTPKQIADNQVVDPDSLPDPASSSDRVKPGYDSFVVVVGLNTGRPVSWRAMPSDPRGPFDGWLCPCDGSVYDPLGRVRSGPATKNLAIPRFTFLNDAQTPVRLRNSTMSTDVKQSWAETRFPLIADWRRLP